MGKFEAQKARKTRKRNFIFPDSVQLFLRSRCIFDEKIIKNIRKICAGRLLCGWAGWLGWLGFFSFNY